MLRAVALCVHAYVKFKSSGTVITEIELTVSLGPKLFTKPLLYATGILANCLKSLICDAYQKLIVTKR